MCSFFFPIRFSTQYLSIVKLSKLMTLVPSYLHIINLKKKKERKNQLSFYRFILWWVQIFSGLCPHLHEVFMPTAVCTLLTLWTMTDHAISVFISKQGVGEFKCTWLLSVVTVSFSWGVHAKYYSLSESGWNLFDPYLTFKFHLSYRMFNQCMVLCCRHGQARERLTMVRKSGILWKFCDQFVNYIIVIR